MRILHVKFLNDLDYRARCNFANIRSVRVLLAYVVNLLLVNTTERIILETSQAPAIAYDELTNISVAIDEPESRYYWNSLFGPTVDKYT